MLVFYNLFIALYYAVLRLLSFRNTKAKEWIRGRKNWRLLLQEGIGKHSKWVWVHCASAGEFEQGKPVIELLKRHYPDYKVIITFFSPSGYGAGKKYKLADHIAYIPLDTESNAKDFLDIVNPELVIFVKYDYWYHFLKATAKRRIPLLLVAAIFRTQQPFFQWYGSLHREMLTFFTHLFVQDQESTSLLSTIGIKHCTVSGDTRFDRVAEITSHFTSLPLIQEFVGSHRVLVAGSTWPDDERLIRAAQSMLPGLKIIIAPHEIHKGHIDSIQAIFPDAVTYSQAEKVSLADKNILIIDNVGMLSRLYHYATITYIGGGFNKSGIHNTLEAAVWGKPVFFGPNFQKFKEAKELVQQKAAYSIKESNELAEQINILLNNQILLQQASDSARNYVLKNVGATNLIHQFIRQNVF